jgi:hypothetical protein
LTRHQVRWAIAWIALGLPVAVSAQAPRRFLPNPSLIPRPIAGPLEPRTAARLVVSLEAASAFGEVVEGEAAFGTTVGVVRFSGSGPDDLVILGVGGGVIARFNMETRERELIASDWMFTLPLIIRRGGHWVRVQYLHTSAHLGDEYVEFFDVERVAHARDALDGLASFDLDQGLRIYGSVRWALHIDPPDDKRVAMRGGVEYTLPGPASIRPFAAIDIESDANNDWAPRVDARAGVWLTPASHWPGTRLEIGFSHGPSFQGQFADLTHTGFAIGVAFTL